jgi:hypothetical protein
MRILVSIDFEPKNGWHRANRPAFGGPVLEGEEGTQAFSPETIQQELRDRLDFERWQHGDGLPVNVIDVRVIVPPFEVLL